MVTVRTARVYEQPEPDQGLRILVDRLWPRGMKKEDPRIGQWFPAVAPSNELRSWYHHHLDQINDFSSRYEAELNGELSTALAELAQIVREQQVTLVTAARDVSISHVPVLARVLAEDK